MENQVQNPAGIEWRQFPQLEKLFEPGNTEPFLRGMEKTSKRLEELAANGGKLEQQRAKAALAAYAHTFELVRKLAEMRNEMAAAQASAPR